MGGLGILDIRKFNLALLAKWLWQWYQPETKLWKSGFEAMHAGNSVLKIFESKFFRSTLRRVHDFLNCFTICTVGNGEKIRFWFTNWGYGILQFEFPILFSLALDPEATLMQVMSRPLIVLFGSIVTNEEWNEFTRLQDIILHVTINNQVEDIFSWKLKPDGSFSVKSAYYMLKDSPRIQSNIHSLWKLKVPPRFQVFGWLAWLNRLLTTDNLVRRGWCLPNICYLCKSQSESVVHLFNSCQFTQELNARVLQDNIQRQGLLQIVQSMDHRQDKKERALITMFILWRERCARIFRGEEKDLSALKEEVHQQKEWQTN